MWKKENYLTIKMRESKLYNNDCIYICIQSFYMSIMPVWNWLQVFIFPPIPPKKLFNALRCHLYGSEGPLKQCLNRVCKIIGFKCVCLYVNFAYFAYFSSNFIFFARFSIYRGKYLLFYTSKNLSFHENLSCFSYLLKIRKVNILIASKLNSFYLFSLPHKLSFEYAFL